MKFLALFFCFILASVHGLFLLSAQENGNDPSGGTKTTAKTAEEQRLDTLRYGTETEIGALIQSLSLEKTDQMDGELLLLAEKSHNRNILSGIFSFFADREKGGLEERAIRALNERDDEATETVLAAINYLGKLKVSGSIGTLEGLINAEERRFMGAAFRAMGQAGSVDKDAGADAAEFLTDFYTRRNPSDDLRREIISAVGETRSSEGLPFLIEIVRNQEERMPLRIAALESLAKIGDPGGLETILAAVPTPDPNVRAAAVSALGPFSGEAVDKAIFEAFRDSYYRTRLAAAAAARERKLIEAVPYLRYRAENDEVPQVKDESIRALGAIGNKDALEILNSLFSERKNADRVRILAAEMLLQDDPDHYAAPAVVELDEAKKRSQTALYNGLLKNISGAKSPQLEEFTRRLFTTGGVIEKSYALDLTLNNEFRGLAAEVRALTDDKNGSLSRKARNTLQGLGLSE